MVDLAPPALAGPEDRLRAALFRATRSDALMQDQIDAGMLALASGYQAEARAILGLVFLQQGSSPEGRASRWRIVSQTGLWPSGPMPAAQPAATADVPIERAIDELRQFMSRIDAGAAPGAVPDVVLPAFQRTFKEPQPARKSALADKAERVAGYLAAMNPFGDGDGFAAHLAAEAPWLASLDPIAVEEFAGESVSAAARLFVLEIYRRFAMRLSPLLALCGEHGVAASAGLSAIALGPYFSHVAYLIRDVRDLFALVEVAVEEGPSQSQVERWALALSLGLRRNQMLDLLDEFGDRGMVRALSYRLQTMAGSDFIDPPKDMVRKIRDAFLDIGEWSRGGKAQELLAMWSLDDPLEWELLSDILSNGGDTAGARDALERAATIEPFRPSLIKRMADLAAGKTVKMFGGIDSGARRPLRLSRLALFRAMD